MFAGDAIIHFHFAVDLQSSSSSTVRMEAEKKTRTTEQDGGGTAEQPKVVSLADFKGTLADSDSDGDEVPLALRGLVGGAGGGAAPP